MSHVHFDKNVQLLDGQTRYLAGQASVRQMVLHELHQSCAVNGFTLLLTPHFLDRINVRAHDQAETFMYFRKAAKFVLDRRETFREKSICMQIGPHYFGLKPSNENNLVCLTYFYNEVGPNTLRCDRHFKLKGT